MAAAFGGNVECDVYVLAYLSGDGVQKYSLGFNGSK